MNTKKEAALAISIVMAALAGSATTDTVNTDIGGAR